MRMFYHGDKVTVVDVDFVTLVSGLLGVGREKRQNFSVFIELPFSLLQYRVKNDSSRAKKAQFQMEISFGRGQSE